MGNYEVPSKEKEYGIYGGFVAAEAITEYLFVKNGNSGIVVAGAGEATLGISVEGTASGEYCDVKHTGLYVLKVDGDSVDIGKGDFLKSDASGRGVKAATDLDTYGAIAMESATVADEYILVLVKQGQVGVVA